jgi:hypothetical protein
MESINNNNNNNNNNDKNNKEIKKLFRPLWFEILCQCQDECYLCSVHIGFRSLRECKEPRTLGVFNVLEIINHKYT